MPFDILFRVRPRVLSRLVTFTLLAALAASCTHHSSQIQSFVSATTQGVPKLTITGIGTGGGIGATQSNPIQVGHDVIISFGLSDPDGKPITSGTPVVYITQEGDVVPFGPTPAKWSPFTGYQATGDHSPAPPIQGVWYATVPMPKFHGVAAIVVYAPGGREQGVGVTHAFVSVTPKVARIRSKATPVATPTATTKSELARVCSRTPPDPLHAISLSMALKNGKPTVAVFSNPGSGATKLDAAVTDEVLLEQQMHGSKMNFVHVDTSKDTHAAAAWEIPPGSAPWVVVIDKNGVIANRFYGATTAPMIEIALKALQPPTKGTPKPKKSP